LKDELIKFLRQDVSSRFWKQKLQAILKFLYFIKQGILHKYCLQRAAGMAYSSLFAMVPTLVVTLSVFSSVKFFPEDLKSKIEILIFKNFIPETSQRLHEQIASYIQGFRDAATTIGLIGAIFMIVSVFFLLNTIENTFNSIMDADKNRSILHKLSAYTFVLVWSPLLVGLAFVLRSDMTLDLSFIEKIGIFYHYVLITGTFTLAYKMIPNKFISTRDAFAGGLCATVLWQLANKTFTHYVSQMVQYDKLYGTLGVIPLFLVWLYMVWVVVLIGMETTYVFQNWKRLNIGLKTVTDPDALALQILRLIGQRYLAGERFETDISLAKKMSRSPHELSPLLNILKKNQLIVPLSDGGSYTLVRHPDHISLWEVVKLFLPSFQVHSKNGTHQVEYLPLSLKMPEDIANLSLGEWLKNNP